jgi:1-acyl-sn-glycerol-3-phosphate acyltransferase
MYSLVVLYARILLGSYYRVRVHGAVAATGPLVLCTNHQNGLADAVLLCATERPVRFLAKATLFRMPLVGSLVRGARAVPVHRPQDQADTSQNLESFAEVHAALRRGELISIFPEGTSDDPRPGLRPLKTGAARLALAAEFDRPAGSPPPGLRVQCLGLVYEHRDRWRSTVHLWIGAPFEVADWSAPYAADPRAAVHDLTARIESELRAVTVPWERAEDRRPLAAAVALGSDEGLPAPAALQRRARELACLGRLHPLEAETWRARLAPWAGGPPPVAGSRGGAALRAAALALALAGGALPFLVPVAIARLLGRWLRPSADKAVTLLLLSASVLVPLWCALLLALAARRGGLPAVAGLALLLAAAAWLAPRAFARRRALRHHGESALHPARAAARRRAAELLRRDLARAQRLAARLRLRRGAAL